MTAAALPPPDVTPTTAPSALRPPHAVGRAWTHREWIRLRWGVRTALVLGVAASVVANILHAQPHLISQAIAAWPPLALLVTVELIARVPVHRRALAAVRLLAATAIAGIAAYVSYWHMVGVAARYGETGASPYLLPLSVDGLIIVASICLVEISGRLQHTTAPTTGTPPADPTAAAAPSQPTPPRGHHVDRVPTVDATASSALPPHATPALLQSEPSTTDRPATSDSPASGSTPATAGALNPRAVPRYKTAVVDRNRPPAQVARPADDEDAIDNDTIPTNPREAIHYWLRRDPDMDVDALADRVGKSVRQVRRYLASPTAGTRIVSGNRTERLADTRPDLR